MGDALVNPTLSGSTGRLYPFPLAARPGATAASVYQAADLDLSRLNLSAAVDLQRLVESTMQQVLSRTEILAGVGMSNPFDAVYISALQADVLDSASLARLKAFSSIEDKSSEIHFADDWDD